MRIFKRDYIYRVFIILLSVFFTHCDYKSKIDGSLSKSELNILDAIYNDKPNALLNYLPNKLHYGGTDDWSEVEDFNHSKSLFISRQSNIYFFIFDTNKAKQKYKYLHYPNYLSLKDSLKVAKKITVEPKSGFSGILSYIKEGSNEKINVRTKKIRIIYGEEMEGSGWNEVTFFCLDVDLEKCFIDYLYLN